MIESRKRSIAKALSYRFFGSMVTMIIALLIVGKWDVALGVGLLDGVAKMAGYFLHERIWAKIKWGVPKRPDYEI
jgi:adenylylsulfate kinase